VSILLAGAALFSGVAALQGHALVKKVLSGLRRGRTKPASAYAERDA